MDISIVLLNDKQVNSGQRIPVSAMHTGKELIPPERSSCYLFPGSPSDEIEGKDILIFGKEYIIGHRRYDLASGYAIRARLTPKLTLIPRLRKAVGKETEIIRDSNKFPANEYWPVIERIWEKYELIQKTTTIPNHAFDFVQEAINTVGELNNLTEIPNLEED